jgi:hypothetical protein
MKISPASDLACAFAAIAREEKGRARPCSTRRQGRQTWSGIPRTRISAVPIRSNSNLNRPSQALPGTTCEKKFSPIESGSPFVARARRAQKKLHARPSGNALTKNNMSQKSLIDAGFCEDAGFMWA